MRKFVRLAVLLSLVGLPLGGCAQGPGHTRALGCALGTAAGAALGACASPCFPAGGAILGAGLGLAVGGAIGDGIACDQERRGCYDRGSCQPCDPCPPPRVVRRRCDPCAPEPAVVRRVVIREHGPPVGTVVSERVIPDPEPIPVIRESQAEPCDFGFRGW